MFWTMRKLLKIDQKLAHVCFSKTNIVNCER